MREAPQPAARKPAHAAAGLSAAVTAVLAAVILTGGCSSGQLPGDLAGTRPAASTVEHWGSFFGQGKGIRGTLTSPVAVTLPGTVAELGTSNSTQYALLTDGRLYAWGLGTHGQLGNGGRADSFRKPVRVRFPAGVKIASIPADAMPYNTGLAVDTTGRAWGWGGNRGGELCTGNTRPYWTPVRLPLSHVTTLAGASGHAVYDAAGTVYACGLNRDGVLGDGSGRSSTTPVRVTGLDGSAVTRLVAAFDNAGALLSDGRYFNWGYNANGQLGDGRTRPSDVPVQVRLPLPVTQVVQGGSFWHNGQTLVRLSDGSLWAWGGRAGQLGNGIRHRQLAPVRFSPPAGVRYRSLATGGKTSYAVSTTGRVYAWGNNHAGQVGDGSTRLAVAPVLVAAGATLISSTAYDVAISVPGRTPAPGAG